MNRQRPSVREPRQFRVVPAWFSPLVIVLAVQFVFSTVAASAGRIDYNRDIRPILSENCYACHGPDKDKRKAGLRLDLKEEAFQKLESGDYALVRGNTAKSKLVYRITTDAEDDRMPPLKTGKRLSATQIDVLRRWVEQGAAWTAHWSYLPPRRPALPFVKNKRWARNEIDYFILARLEKEGLQPGVEADKYTLIRRLTFDLTGLPPPLPEVDAFVKDRSADAYEKLVDRLLGSPHYGERLALNWLDLARYADTSGYHFDSPRFMHIWREWVISAFNRNLPFDQFTIEQLAGDLLPGATRDQKIATGFHRNLMTNDEGGADPDEYLSKYVVDRVSTTAAVWLGMTLGCAECHDHKYDPVTQKEFYQMYAFFHNVPEKGLDGTRVSNPLPKLEVPSDQQSRRRSELTEGVAAAEKVVKTRETELPEAQKKWEQTVLKEPLKPMEPDGLVARFALDETATGVDFSGNKLAASLKGTNTTWVEGKLGKALKFAGKDDSVEAGDIVRFERTNTFSYGCWMKYQDKGGALISKMETEPGFRGFDLLVQDGKIEAHLVNTWPDNALKVQGKETIPKDQWLHVWATYDGSSKPAGLKIYVNGKSQALETKADKLSDTIANNVTLRIGQRLNSLPFSGTIDDVRIYDRALQAKEVGELAAYANRVLVQVPTDKRTAEQQSDLRKYFRENHATELHAAEKELADLRQAKDDLQKQIPDTMVMEELEKPRDTFILVRGNFQQKGEKVTANVPQCLPPLPKDASPGRLGLAKWLVSSDQPLTARVAINRYWQMVFGTGLVKTVNDFGSQGEWPSHPELLDWLATEFMARHWDVKSMVKLMVTSAAYRQSAAVTSKFLERDPYNRLLARGPRLRLDAELIRDNALAVSGLLNSKIGGESVKPYQPSGIWEITDRKYEQSHGEDLYRRGMYVYWKRAAHYPSFATFDAPNREVCTLQRPRTSTPLQSLVLLNDPVYVEAARALAQRVLREGGPELGGRLSYAFRLTLARPPTKVELAVLERTYGEQRRNFECDRKAAAEFLEAGESPRPKRADVVELAAWTGVANVLLNLNETITK